ncbi:MAG: hypothetical protein WC417_06360 [Candidatus Omnitrophota bacterium]|jgi:hypothetical protein
MNHIDVIKNFRYGKNRRGSRVFADGNVLYSYGRHFPLVIRRDGNSNIKSGSEWFLCNGDKYSRSTSKHQSYTFPVFPDFPRVAFSALRAAGINPLSCYLVDFEKDIFKTSNTWDDNFINFKSEVPRGAEYHEDRSLNGELFRKYYHLIGGCLLKHFGNYYICGMDEGSYFVSQLPRKVTTISGAYKMLKPYKVQQAEKDGLRVIRQGEWFFIPRPDIKIKEKQFVKSGTLPRENEQSNKHICTRLFKSKGRFYAKGICRHYRANGRKGDHRPLKLGDGKQVFEAVENMAKGSWSANGRVD